MVRFGQYGQIYVNLKVWEGGNVYGGVTDMGKQAGAGGCSCRR